MSSNIRRRITTPIALAVLCWSATAIAGGTPEQKCEAGKNDAAGKYTACLEKAQKSYVLSNDLAAYGVAVTKCSDKLQAKWDKLEAAATAAGTTCPSSGDFAPIEGFVDACTASVAEALSGGTLGPDPITCAFDLSSCESGLGSCESDLGVCESDLASETADHNQCESDLQTCQSTTARITKTGQTICYNDAGTLIACAGSKRDGQYQAGTSPSFTDNGNGTVTDNITGLMWEKLSDDGSIHDKDTNYAGLSAAIGKADSLNAMNFAGHNDWRIPNNRELMSIVNYGVYHPATYPAFNSGCVAGCTVLTCSCTLSNVYTTSTIYLEYPQANWRYNFEDGDMYAGYSTDNIRVRAVRTAF